VREPDGDEVDRLDDHPVPTSDPEVPTEDAMDQARDTVHPNRLDQAAFDREAPEADALDQRRPIELDDEERPLSSG
jgi:hypothetical protein